MEEHRNKDCVVRKKNKKNEFYSAAMKAKKQRKKKSNSKELEEIVNLTHTTQHNTTPNK